MLSLTASLNGITHAGRAFVIFFFDDVGQQIFQFSQRVFSVGACFIVGLVASCFQNGSDHEDRIPSPDDQGNDLTRIG